MNQTIFALSTGHVKAAVAVIRVSGPLSSHVARQFCRKDLIARRAELVDILDPKTAEILDVGLIIWFPNPHSYTGEDVVEFQSHGGSAVTAAILGALAVMPGLRLAEQGEFTRRAFENGKMTLDSVEGLADLLSAETQYERREALHRVQGTFGDSAELWRKDLIEARALVEAGLDFSDEADVPQAIHDDVAERIARVSKSVALSLQKARRQELLLGGFLVLIAGPPNAGKSTLLNAFVDREVAITSEYAGTTRDLIEVSVDLGGMRVVLIDSAGLRDTDDPVEKIGLSKALLRAREANLIMWIGDKIQPLPPESLSASDARMLVVTGKCDMHPPPYLGIPVSAFTGAGVQELMGLIRIEAQSFFGQFEGVPVIRQRQISVAGELLSLLESARTNAAFGAFELCAEDLLLGTRCLGALVENVESDEILDEVFHRFCLGK